MDKRKRIIEVLKHYGAIKGKGVSEYHIKGKTGLIHVNNIDLRGKVCSVYMRVDNPELAAGELHGTWLETLNKKSGAWNFHWFKSDFDSELNHLFVGLGLLME